MKYFVKLYTGYCGSSACDLIELEDTLSEEDLESIFYDMAVENAEMYGIELCSDDCEDDDCKIEHPGNCGIEGYGVEYIPELHDPYLT